ncbi:MSI3, partial [Symbiodinium sp. CCMP2456]
ATDTPGLPRAVVQKQEDEETAMQADMKEIIETDEKRNDLESYILTMRDKCSEGGQYGAFISSAEREKFDSDLLKAEDWLYDTFDATKVQYI